MYFVPLVNVPYINDDTKLYYATNDDIFFFLNQKYHPRATAETSPLEVAEIHLRG
jgi:hypothetical protein